MQYRINILCFCARVIQYLLTVYQLMPPTASPAPAQSAPAPAAPKPNAAPVQGNAPRPRERAGDIVWRDAGDGSLYTVYKNQPYRAIPMAAWGLPTERMVEKRVINGVEYAIFALKDGRIL